MKFVIQHVPGVPERAELVAAILDILPGAIVVEDEGDPMDTYRRCLIDEAHWQFEDDIILAPDFLERIKRVPVNCLVRGFSRQRHHGIMPPSSFLWNQCVWMPRGYGTAIAATIPEWTKANPEHPTGFDMITRDWLMSRKESYWMESPSLVQHAEGKSLLGPRPHRRISPTFEETYGNLLSTPEPETGKAKT